MGTNKMYHNVEIPVHTYYDSIYIYIYIYLSIEYGIYIYISNIVYIYIHIIPKPKNPRNLFDDVRGLIFILKYIVDIITIAQMLHGAGKFTYISPSKMAVQMYCR